MTLIYPFSTNKNPELSEVGGKALSLIRMTRHGFPVPSGFVLTVEFFQPWIEHVQQTAPWAAVVISSPEDLKIACEAVKSECTALELDVSRRQALSQAFETLKGDKPHFLVAVRSSSPEEDVEGASFAGGYETTLGVTEECLEEAVKRSFASCFDERVLLYKRERGYTWHEPRIAVIVQEQIPAEVSGVAFSLNPTNNCYDELVINANFGLGESVVSGSVTPDTFIVDKVKRTLLERKPGKKETSIWLATEGGTLEKPSLAHSQMCLSDEEALALTDMVVRIEEQFQKPIDVEWAWANGKLHMLQARPITGWVPLPSEMQTRPGEPRTLYIDLTLYKQGVDRPLSVLGMDYWERIQKAVAGTGALFGAKDGLIINSGGRTYSNLSLGLKLQSKEKTAAAVRIQDALSAQIVENLDDSYIAARLPRRVIGALLKVALKRVWTLLFAFQSFSNHKKRHKRFVEKTEELERSIEEIAGRRLSLEQLAAALTQRFGDYMANESLPVTIAAEMARARIKKLFRDDDQEIRNRIPYLERALPNNVTIEMGLDMFQLARSPEIRHCSTREEFVSALEAGSFPAEFINAWDRYIERYGMRCPLELDVATPRFYEMPGAIYDQLSVIAMNEDDETNPQTIFENGIVERKKTYDFLLGVVRKKGRRAEKKFKKYYDILVTFGGYRETFKYYIVVIIDKFRKRVLAEAQALVADGRLDSVEQVFDLSIQDIDRGLVDHSLDLRAMSRENGRFLEKARRVKRFPLVIDSRGKILRPPRIEIQDGEIAGEPISAGKASGKAKVLKRPDEKPVMPGEILVARATDPGWTPLFLNASGVILEVGGMLQHGALVAREYGKPCVAGVENATSVFKDGQMIEMDGANGLIRFL